MATRSSAQASIEIKKIKTSNDAYYRALSARDLHAMEKGLDVHGRQHVDRTA
jgi:hypothetical protein